MKLATSPSAMQTPAPDAIEVLMTLSLGEYAEMGHDIEALRKQLNLPKSASNTAIILEAVHRQARSG